MVLLYFYLFNFIKFYLFSTDFAYYLFHCCSDNDEHDIIERYCSSLGSSPAHKTNGERRPSDILRDPILREPILHSPLKSPMQIVMSLEDNQKTELEAMIKDLEEQNR